MTESAGGEYKLVGRHLIQADEDEFPEFDAEVAAGRISGVSEELFATMVTPKVREVAAATRRSLTAD